VPLLKDTCWTRKHKEFNTDNGEFDLRTRDCDWTHVHCKHLFLPWPFNFPGHHLVMPATWTTEGFFVFWLVTKAPTLRTLSRTYASALLCFMQWRAVIGCSTRRHSRKGFGIRFAAFYFLVCYAATQLAHNTKHVWAATAIHRSLSQYEGIIVSRILSELKALPAFGGRVFMFLSFFLSWGSKT